jgi:hypothetical protein
MEQILSLEEHELAPPNFTIDDEINRQFSRFNSAYSTSFTALRRYRSRDPFPSQCERSV